MRKIYIINEFARDHGIKRATLIDFLRYTILARIEPDEDYRQSQVCKLIDGRHWIRFTKQELFEELGLLKIGTINNSVKYLRNNGIIETRQMSPNGYDRSLWYSFVDEEKYLINFEDEYTNEDMARSYGCNVDGEDIILKED